MEYTSIVFHSIMDHLIAAMILILSTNTNMISDPFTFVKVN